MKSSRHNIGLYLRVSTDEQAVRHEGSIDNQKHRLTSFVDIKNMQDPGWGRIAEIYSDDGFSAKDTKRPAFQRMMKDVKKGKLNLILVTDLSRLSRNILDFCLLLEDLRKASAQFLSLKEQFDTTTAAGEMMVFNMINLAQFERKQTSERVSLNFHARAMRGLRNGGQPLLGYDIDPGNASTYILNPAEAQDVKAIFQMFIEEGSLNRLAKKLNTGLIKPKSVSRAKCRHNAKGSWTAQSLHNLLRNQAYVALREINRANKDKDQNLLKSFQKYQVVKASWPAIVDRTLFDEVQKLLNDNAKLERARLDKAEERIFLLSGFMNCGECGRPLMGTTGHGEKTVHRYYVHRPISGETVTCSVKSVRADEIEQEILNHLDATVWQEGYLDKIEGRIAEMEKPLKNEILAEQERRQAELVAVEKDIQAAFRLHSEMGALAIDDLFKDRLKNLRDRKIEIEARLKELTEQLEEEELSPDRARQRIERTLLDFQKARKSANRMMLKRLLRKIFASIVVGPDEIAVRYWTDAESLGDGQIHKNKVASDLVSEATVLEFPCPSISPEPPLPLAAGAEAVGCLPIIKIGRGGGI